MVRGSNFRAYQPRRRALVVSHTHTRTHIYTHAHTYTFTRTLKPVGHCQARAQAEDRTSRSHIQGTVIMEKPSQMEKNSNRRGWIVFGRQVEMNMVLWNIATHCNGMWRRTATQNEMEIMFWKRAVMQRNALQTTCLMLLTLLHCTLHTTKWGWSLCIETPQHAATCCNTMWNHDENGPVHFRCNTLQPSNTKMRCAHYFWYC